MWSSPSTRAPRSASRSSPIDGNYGNPIGRDVEGPWQHFDGLLAEPFIKGRELTVAVLGSDPLAVTELKPKAGFYDYDAKYTDGLTEHVCPAQVPYEIAQSMMDMAARAHQLLGCKGASRSDFRWDDELGEAGIYLLEVNTQPGMTPLSLVPEQAKHNGIAYGELVERLIAEALSMSAAHVRRGGVPAAPRRKKSRKVAVPRKIVKRLPVDQARANKVAGLVVRRLRAGDRAGGADRARHSGQGRARGRRRGRATPALPSAAIRSSASTRWTAASSTRWSPMN